MFTITEFIFFYISFIFSVLELPPRLDHLTPRIPDLMTLLQDIESLADSGAKYEDAPEMIDIILPMICRY